MRKKSGDWLILEMPEFFVGDNLVLHEKIFLKSTKCNEKHLKEMQMLREKFLVRRKAAWKAMVVIVIAFQVFFYFWLRNSLGCIPV